MWKIVCSCETNDSVANTLPDAIDKYVKHVSYHHSVTEARVYQVFHQEWTIVV